MFRKVKRWRGERSLENWQYCQHSIVLYFISPFHSFLFTLFSISSAYIEISIVRYFVWSSIWISSVKIRFVYLIEFLIFQFNWIRGKMPPVYGGPLTTFEDSEKESEYGYVRKVLLLPRSVFSPLRFQYPI